MDPGRVEGGKHCLRMSMVMKNLLRRREEERRHLHGVLVRRLRKREIGKYHLRMSMVKKNFL
jgi:hypothetical protein